MFHLQI
jgi:hypothetical protein